MTFIHLLFYALSVVGVSSATMVVISSNTVRAALYLVLTFFCVAGLWLLLHAEFLALTLVLVYVGAVMTLFLFVVMMLSVTTLSKTEGFVRFLPIVILVLLAMVGMTVYVVGPQHFGLNQILPPAASAIDYSNTAQLGELLYSSYAYPFEVAGMILLAAIVAAITLTHGDRAKNYKSQNVSEQIAVNPKDRMRLVNMPSATRRNAGDVT